MHTNKLLWLCNFILQNGFEQTKHNKHVNLLSYKIKHSAEEKYIRTEYICDILYTRKKRYQINIQ